MLFLQEIYFIENQYFIFLDKKKLKYFLYVRKKYVPLPPSFKNDEET